MDNTENDIRYNNYNSNKEEQILISVTGQDRPGLTAQITNILANYDATLDIGQADIHATLSLGILIRIDDRSSGQVMKELLFKANELGVNIGFSPITDEEYEAAFRPSPTRSMRIGSTVRARTAISLPSSAARSQRATSPVPQKS